MQPTEYNLDKETESAISPGVDKKKNGLVLALQIIIIIIGFVLIALIVYANFYQKPAVVENTKSVVTVEDTTPIFRDDIVAYIVSDIAIEDEVINYYALRFYSDKGVKISPLIAVATSSLYIDEGGIMSIQVADDANTATGQKYASARVYGDVFDPADTTAESIEVGAPCILSSEKSVVACNSFTLELVSESTDVVQTPNKIAVISNGNLVKGLSITIAPEKQILAQAKKKGSSKPHNSGSSTNKPNKPPQKKKEPTKDPNNPSPSDVSKQEKERDERWKREREYQEEQEEKAKEKRAVEKAIEKALDNVVDSLKL